MAEQIIDENLVRDIMGAGQRNRDEVYEMIAEFAMRSEMFR